MIDLSTAVDQRNIHSHLSLFRCLVDRFDSTDGGVRTRLVYFLCIYPSNQLDYVLINWKRRLEAKSKGARIKSEGRKVKE